MGRQNGFIFGNGGDPDGENDEKDDGQDGCVYKEKKTGNDLIIYCRGLHMNHQPIYHLASRVQLERIGNKARNLQSLMEIRSIHIPDSWVIPWDVYQRYQTGDQLVLEKLESAIQHHLDLSKSYAVRSSSNIEDASFHSYAGLFKTFLNVQGVPDLRNAVIEVWEAIHADAVRMYLEKLSLSPEAIHMAVIIQEMVQPEFSGVLFSCNPMTGLSEVVIEGVPGEGTTLVQDGVTPERWVSRKGLWVAKPEDSCMPTAVAKKVLDEAQKILKKVSAPIDLEWVYDGRDVFWVQMREITTMKDLRIYSNRFSKDVMPGMIHPLIWSINIPLTNTIWLGLLEEIVGKLPIEPEDLAKSFYYRSYFDMGTIGEVFSRVGFPSEGLEMMMGLVPSQEGKPAFKPSLKLIPLLPKLMRFIFDKWTFERKINSRLPPLEINLQKFTPHLEPDVPFERQIEEVNQLYNLVQKIVYFNVVTPIIASMYTRLLEHQLNKVDVDLLQFDLFEGLRELDQYNPNLGLMKLREKHDAFIKSSGMSPDEREISLVDLQGTAFEEDLNLFIDQFGHLSSNSNNFMAVPWRENPDTFLRMIRDSNALERDKQARIGFDDLPVKGFRKLMVGLYYRRARKFSCYRERVSKDYICGYGLFRPYILRLANGMVSAGWLDDTEDVFYLTWEEIQQVVETKEANSLREKIIARKEEMDAYQDIILPDVIYGDDPPPVFSECLNRLYGTPTSQGYYSGPVKVITSMDDFQKVTVGDVIVIPYSDVGWTPLFTLAGAVISESGGLLSHSSIIAREYQIPAVVSVPNCMQLKDLQQVSVNGFTGEIVVVEDIKQI
jgi:phosphohistidine swiveling domain-containing protein